MLQENYKCNQASYDVNELHEFAFNCAPEAWRTFFVLPEVLKELGELTGAFSFEATMEENHPGIEPPMPLMFEALKRVQPAEVKVVILGQDPTPQAGLATGLAFSVINARMSPSVTNVLLEVALEGFNVNINNGDLSLWAAQGVLLLNTALTVVRGKAKSHVGRWKGFTELLIQYINKNAKPSVWLLWGKEARSYAKFIETSKHYVITGGHPSPKGGKANTFFGKNYFGCANKFLSLPHVNRTLVNWALAQENVLEQCP